MTFHLDRVDRAPRLSDLVSERLLTAIRDARLAPGAKLPSERELGDQFGVSRTVIREAIRHLAARGVLDVRSGSGATVAQVDGSNVSDALALFLGRTGLPEPGKIHEVRALLETQTARLAAERATDEHVAEIRRAHERLGGFRGDLEAAAAADVAFHRAIAQATENELFVVLVDAIGDLMMDVRRATVSRPGRVQVGYEYHGRILAAIERRDADGAVRAMSDHLVESLEALMATTDRL
jgi:GntR family transcriptional regulator, transcriptional repressor for pyruvate dehydrogenase complex